MRKVTPSEAITKIQYFIDRVDRINKNEYSDKRFLTQDMNRLKFEYGRVYLWHSIAVFNKNKERAKEVIDKCKISYKLANSWLHPKP